MDSKLDLFFYTENKVKNYKLQWIVDDVLKIPKELKSPIFTFFPELIDEQRWRLSIENSDTKSATISLHCITKRSLHLRVGYTVIFRKPEGMWISEASGDYVFSGNGSTVLHSNLNEVLRLGRTETLNVEFNFNIYGMEDETETYYYAGGDDDDDALDPPEDFMDIKDNKKLMDLKIHVGNETFETHKFVLRLRIPKFVDEYLKDLGIGEITLKGFDPDSFRDILNYIYEVDVPLKAMSKSTVKLYEFATKYDLKHLQKMCVEEFEISVSIQNAVEYLKLSATYNDEGLEGIVSKFLNKNFSIIKETVKWKEFASSNPELAKKVIHFKAK